MQKMQPPVRVVCPGKVHRNDAPDATHSPIFHQVEGLAVDTNITFCDLKGTLDHAMKALFGSSVKTRFYPSFFRLPSRAPTSRSVAFSVTARACATVLHAATARPAVGSNCWAAAWSIRMCMVRRLRSGKSFGIRLRHGRRTDAILKYGVDDIQLFFQGDVRFLEQFG